MEELKNLTILYLEDENTIRLLLTEMLKKRVKEVVAVSNGHEGLEVIDSVNPDVIITDLEMPGMGGIEFLKEVRKTKNIKSIILSGYEENLEHIDIADFMIVKPVNKRALFAKLKEFALNDE